MDEIIGAVETVLQHQDWKVEDPLPVADDRSPQVTIGALARSLALELPVDIAVRISADGDTTVVDMRSASHYGRHDLGDNARRILDFLRELDQQVSTQTGATPSVEAQ
jgi:hypothetical protein